MRTEEEIRSQLSHVCNRIGKLAAHEEHEPLSKLVKEIQSNELTMEMNTLSWVLGITNSLKEVS